MSKYLVDITQELNAIRTTPYGKTMRPNLADAIEKLNKRHNALSETFDNMVIDAGNSNAEVVDARNDAISQPPVNHPTLGDRLNAMQQQISSVPNNVGQIVQEVEQARGPHNNLNDRLNGIDNKFNDYLPLTGGDITGDLEVNGNLTNGGNLVWHEGNLIPEVNAVPDTVVKRSGVANINIGRGVAFNDVPGGGGYLGGVGIESGNSHGVPYTDQPVHLIPRRGHTQIWTNETMPVQSGAWTPQFTGSLGGTTAYVSRDGQYFRIGNLVVITFNLIATNPVNFSGQLSVTNLPFVNATGTHVGCSLFAIRGFNVGSPTNNRQICAYVRPNESRIIFNYSDTSATASNIAVLTEGHIIQGNQIEISATVTFKVN